MPASTGHMSNVANPHVSPACVATPPTSSGTKLVSGEMSDVTLSTTPDLPGCVEYACPIASGCQLASIRLKTASRTYFAITLGTPRNAARLTTPIHTLQRNNMLLLIERSSQETSSL